MAYTTFEFYIDNFGGAAINSEADFKNYLNKATFKLNELTFGNITEETAETYATQISFATCALIDSLYKFDLAAANVNDPEKGNIKSMSSGGESISFGNNDTVYTASLSNVNEQYKVLRSEISPYLANTGLLYAGIGG